MNRRTNPSILLTVLMLLPLLFSTTAAAADKLEVVESETGFYYTVQKGDTLWDLSRQFNDSPWLWPELWEENDQIRNPHWIFPGERILLYRKSGEQVVPEVPTSKPIQPVPVKSAPVAEKRTERPYFVYSSIDRVGFIRKPAVTPTGRLLAVEGKKEMISEGDVIYVEPTADAGPGELIPGSRYTIYRTMAPTDARDSEETIGVQHYILGIAEVTRKAPDLATAKVIKSFHAIETGALLMPFTQRSPRVELKSSTPGIDGRIITSEEHSELTGDYTVAFIDKGLADNIAVGQQYSIYNQKVVPELDGNGERRMPPVDFGSFLVLHTEQTTATVVVTNAFNNIPAGSQFRTPVE